MGKRPPAYLARRGTGATIAAVALGLMGQHLLAAPSDAAADKPIYDRYCGACHDIGIGARNGEGPQLNGITGMPAGNMPGFTYSTAIRRSAIVWTAKSLADFIENPRDSVPGNHMDTPGVGAAADRAAIVRYLARFRRDGSATAP